ncbi:MAG TPA: nucleotidyltransferase domain-containing protein [Trinickia sp.]|uniref:nucleotidyltransferase domain-containing protein n=1 Tax=Trinickia sp. TaxID=2571163 RepID=UPI002B89F38A|nr:nucleotidyltransferase domain-containing protein [Trinickia sp.]HVW51498.1 nucleotidyltransferase domain-containing protein [Trinickia sp.]
MNETMFAELFGGVGRFKALRYLFEHPNEEFSARELAVNAKLDPGNTHRWLQRWEAAGLVRRGTTKAAYRVAQDPALAPLITLFHQSSALVADLRHMLLETTGVQAAFIFGSFARHEEKAESDIDVLVLGNVSELRTNALLRPLARKYNRPFNATVFTSEQFRALLTQGDPFATEVMRQPRIALIGEMDVAAR